MVDALDSKSSSPKSVGSSPTAGIPRGISSVGRAVASHATGQGFEFPMLHNEKGTFVVPFLLWHKSVIPLDLLRAVHELPGSPGARRARAVVEHTRKPGGLPRPERRGHLRAGTPAPAGGEWGRQVRDSNPLCSRLRKTGSSPNNVEFEFSYHNVTTFN